MAFRNRGLSEPITSEALLSLPSQYVPEGPTCCYSLPFHHDGRQMGRIVINERGRCWLRAVTVPKLRDLEYLIFDGPEPLRLAVSSALAGSS